MVSLIVVVEFLSVLLFLRTSHDDVRGGMTTTLLFDYIKILSTLHVPPGSVLYEQNTPALWNSTDRQTEKSKFLRNFDFPSRT